MVNQNLLAKFVDKCTIKIHFKNGKMYTGKIIKTNLPAIVLLDKFENKIMFDAEDISHVEVGEEYKV